MPSVFLFGTLQHAPLYEIVTGTDLLGRPADLADTRVARVEGKAWPVLVVAPGATARGLLVEVGEDVLERLDFYEACFGYIRQSASVRTADGAVNAALWRPAGTSVLPGPDDWSLDTWAEAQGALSILAAAEVMRRIGHEEPARVARRFGIIEARADAWLRTGDWRRPGLIGEGPGADSVEVIARRHAYDGFFNVEELDVLQPRFDGQPPVRAERGVFRVGDAVTVLPYDPLRDRIHLIEQLRFGPLAHGDPAPWILEAIAGILDAGETAEATARREALEEAALELGELHFVARYYPTPGGVAQVLHSYVAIADLPDHAAVRGGHAGEGEDIQSHIVPFDLACRLLEGGDMANAPLILSMQWLIMHREALRAAAGVA